MVYRFAAVVCMCYLTMCVDFYFMSFVFFFFKQKTAYEMRISDWSSDVCSSDLLERGDEFGPAIGIARIIERVDADIEGARTRRLGPAEREAEADRVARGHVGDRNVVAHAFLGHRDIGGERPHAQRRPIANGSASWRGRGCQLVSITEVPV